MNTMLNEGVALTALLSGLLPALAVSAAAWVLVRFTPRMNGATRHVIWWLVLAVAVLLPVGFTIRDAGKIRPQQRPIEIRLSAPDPDDPIVFTPPRARRSLAAPEPSRSTQAALQVRAGRWSAWLLILWVGIFAAQICRLGWNYLRLRGIKRRAWAAPPEVQQSFQAWMAACAIRRPVRLRISDEVVTPLAAGFRHPAVILPARLLGEFGQTELDHVLLHELSHLVRRDDWTNLAGRVAFATVWFNPAAVWALRRIEREREIACDEWVVEATGAPRPYAASLARLFEFCAGRRRDALAAGMAGHGSHLGERIEILVRRRVAPVRGVSILRVAGCAVALLTFVGLAAQAPRWIVLAQDAPAPPAPRVSPQAPAPPAVPRSPKQPATAPGAVAPDPHSFLAAVVASGYGDLSVDEIIQLRNNGVSAKYLMGISRAGWGKLKPHEIINLHNSGVSAEFLRAAGDAAIPGLTTQGVIDLNASGVTAAYIDGLQAAGLGAFSKDQIISLHNSGVRPGLLAALKEAGFTRLDAQDIIEAQNNGLRSEDLREARHFGSSLTLKQILKLKQAGVLQNE